MASKLTALAAGLAAVALAQRFPGEDLILCDCGIGDNEDHAGWSTSRQMNWYQDIAWPRSAYSYPDAPDMATEVPFKDGTYPWVPSGVTATMPNGDVWTAYIEDGTPDGFKAGSAVTTKEGGQLLNCWAYRGRPVSAAVNVLTMNHDAICWSAFALRDIGLNSLWFNQNPVIPSNNGTNATSQSWVVMPEAFTIQATDAATSNVVGRLSYKTHYDGFLSGPCSTCETGRFNSQFFDPIIAAVQGSFPVFSNFTIEAQCDPWMACI